MRIRASSQIAPRCAIPRNNHLSVYRHFFRKGVASALGLVVVCSLFVSFAVAEDAESRAGRLDGLVESLNANSERRGRALESIYAELRGPNAREMQQVLRESLSRENTLILQGVIEGMAMLGDPDDVAYLEALLATSRRPEVKSLIIRLLPAFCLGHSERARFNYIRYAVGYDRVAGPEILEPLRRPPVTRRGRIDAPREQMQGRVVRALAGQFDPVAAALRYIDDRLYGSFARLAVGHYVGNSLGGDPAGWVAIWEAQGDEVELLRSTEVEEIRLAALQSLADMGAEGLPELLDAFRVMLSSGNDIIRQACYDTLAVMCEVGFTSSAALAEIQFSPEDVAEGDNWRHRRHAATERLILFASTAVEADLTLAADSGSFAAAASCLGAALSFPAAFSDAGGRLAERRIRGIQLLERMAMMPDISREQRGAVLAALGRIGAERAVSAIASVVDSPYCSADFGDAGRLLAESAIDALRVAATGVQSGRDSARSFLLALLGSDRKFPPIRPGTPPVGLAHMVLWRLQRLARTNDTSLDADTWRQRLGW